MLKNSSSRYKWAVIAMSFTLFSCAGQKPDNLGVFDNEFSPCPESPNCISSDAKNTMHHVDAFKLNTDYKNSWQAIFETISELKRTKVISFDEHYLHAECSSLFFGFVDDLQLHYREQENYVAVKSASRLGHSDFGVNSKRITGLRELLLKNGIIIK